MIVREGERGAKKESRRPVWEQQWVYVNAPTIHC